MNRLKSYGLRSLLAMAVMMLITAFALVAVAPPSAEAAGTTSLTITRYASDRTTILGQKTVTWQELAAGVLNDGTTIPIMGDGITHYYHQGPLFIDDPDEATEQALRWNPEENFNWYGKDYGALRGTNVTDLCNLVGGMASGEEVKVLSSDGWYKYYAYENVYQYPSRTGPMVVTWEKNGMTPLTGYNEGMRLVWFAEATWHDATDTSMGTANPAGMYHVFGVWDWHESAAEKYWYYYMSGGEKYPTTTGLSGQVCSQLIIFSNEAPPAPPTAAFSADITSGTAPLTVNFTDASSNIPTSWAWDFNNDGATDSTVQNPSYDYSTAGTYSVKLTVTNALGSDDEIKTDYITVSPTLPSPPTLTADTTDNTVGQAVNITFIDDKAWREAINDITVNGNSIAGQYKLAKGKIIIYDSVFTEGHDYAIVVTAAGYGDATVNQAMVVAPPVLYADKTDNMFGQTVYIRFTNPSTGATWGPAITDVTVNGESITGKYTVHPGSVVVSGTIEIASDVFPSSGRYEIVVKATGYVDATIIQPIKNAGKN